MNNIVESHLEYVRRTAEIQAWRVVRRTDRAEDLRDIEQEILLQIVRSAPRYDNSRSRPKTFIAMVARQAATKIIVRLLSRKEGIIRNAESL